MAKRLARLALPFIDRLIWLVASPLLLLLCRPRKPADAVRSVLHVSFISHKPAMLARLMRERGLDAAYLAIHGEQGWLVAGGKPYDYNIPGGRWRFLRPLYAVYYLCCVLRRYDVIHYHFSSLLGGRGQELTWLRRMGKLIVFHFRGCDARQKSVNLALNPLLNCCQECDYPQGFCDTAYQRFKLSLAARYADLQLVTTPDLLDFVPQGHHLPFIPPQGVDLAAVVPAARDRKLFRVVTSSNHHGVDGTRHLRAAVARLQAEGEALELVEVVQKPFPEALSIYKSADVYVGKLLMGYYNNANIECLLMGVPCMSYIRPEYLAALGECPIINTRPHEVYENLKRWLHDREGLKALGARGPEFIRRHHDVETILGRLFELYAQALEQKRGRSTERCGH